MCMTSGNYLSRRGFLQATGLGTMAAVAGPGLAAGAGTQGLVSADQLWAWNRTLASFGPRLTGTPAHAAYVDWLADKFARTGLKVHRDRLTFTKWTPRRWSLTVAGKPVDVAFYFPYSGVTPPAGVTAPLVYLGVSPLNAVAWSLARGKIAVVDVPTPPLPAAATFLETGRYAPGMASPDLLMSQPAVTDVVTAPLLKLAAQAGVLGVVCIRVGVSDALAKDQYSPFTTPYQGCPALWLGPTAGFNVRLQALLGAKATLTMDATLTKGAST